LSEVWIWSGWLLPLTTSKLFCCQPSRRPTLSGPAPHVSSSPHFPGLLNPGRISGVNFSSASTSHYLHHIYHLWYGRRVPCSSTRSKMNRSISMMVCLRWYWHGVDENEQHPPPSVLPTFEVPPTSSSTTSALRTTKKGGVLGKKRGKYNRDSRSTLWRYKVHLQISAWHVLEIKTPWQHNTAISP